MNSWARFVSKGVGAVGVLLVIFGAILLVGIFVLSFFRQEERQWEGIDPEILFTAILVPLLIPGGLVVWGLLLCAVGAGLRLICDIADTTANTQQNVDRIRLKVAGTNLKQEKTEGGDSDS